MSEIDSKFGLMAQKAYFKNVSNQLKDLVHFEHMQDLRFDVLPKVTNFYKMMQFLICKNEKIKE